MTSSVHDVVAFLRGVMPRGKNAVKMADVRQVLGGNGFDDVRTWIQSGNIALRTDLDAATVVERIHALLRAHLQVDLPAIVKTPAQLREILEQNPFSSSAYDEKRVFYALCNAPLADPKDLSRQDYGEEQLAILPQAAYLYIPGDASRSRLGNAFLENKLGQVLTTRNGNTLRKMVDF
ncbi:DUF1697 domain-containing protein [Vandammella animalimorsus]|uniref:DUF1697 domain-containing protein n=1 Tax=Vandammella animalimorsus TaxID=2029117 RepID=UPI000BAA8A9D|nr:DUF1697 domain-containing protein [Vandammella animalimorsus]PAT32791.1 hypothetical protein CK626_03815 [Vandammella animalimorsus]